MFTIFGFAVRFDRSFGHRLTIVRGEVAWREAFKGVIQDSINMLNR